MDSSNFFTIALILGGLALFCLVPFILFAVVVYFVTPQLRGWLDRFIIPNPAGLRQEVRALRATNPTLSDDELAKKIINLNALKAGLIGVLSGFGGAITSIGLTPVDITLSIRLQAHMIGLISCIYNRAEVEEQRLELNIYAILGATDTRQLNKIAGQVVQQLVLRTIIRALVKMVLQSFPFLGALAGFGINWLVTQTAGRVAVEWYKKNWTPSQVKELAGQAGAGAKLLGNQALKKVSAATRRSNSISNMENSLEASHGDLSDFPSPDASEDESKQLNIDGEEELAFSE